MPRQRWIDYRGRPWRLSDLARDHGLRPQTLASRLDRAGLPIERALVTGLCTPSVAGARGAHAWRGSHRALFGVTG